MLPAQETQYNAVAGVSVGSLSSFMIAQYPMGQEAQASTALTNLWNSINGSSSVYVDWPGGIITGLTVERGLVDNSPLRKLMEKNWSGKFQRNITVGTTNLNTGHFDNYNETTGANNAIEMSICSASIPAFFPFQSFMGGNYVDGMVVYGIDIDSAVKRCYAVTGDYSKIIVDMLSDHHYALNQSNANMKSYEAYERANAIKKYDKGLFELYWALNAYPTVNFRYYIMPSTSLGAICLNFTKVSIDYNYNLGIKDANYIVSNNVYARDIVNQWIADNGGIIKDRFKSKTIHI
mmetsp:Transcript_2074/g.1943  ORF Transcript_2074/g.1943 Transcript_2074/m.1943 type:complete len:292 (+) Transcript_2074:187-1062(+)